MKTSSKLHWVQGQRSWRVASKTVEAFVTETGGQLAPVTFDLGSRKVQPFHVAPWCREKLGDSQPSIIQALRGDFFCMPFGGNASKWKREQHPVHGETANAKWALEASVCDHGTYCLHLTLDTRIRRGCVDKVIFLREGHPVVYCRHVLMSYQGPMCFGHHAMLRFPEPDGSGLISTSPFKYGQVFPGQFEDPAQGGYSCLKQGATFKSLNRVPLAVGGHADLTQYPARRGFEDLAMVVSDPRAPFAWTAVVFPKERYAWFALKNPRVLRNTVFWISNGGRHYPPWNGRHVNVMGIEDITGYFHHGLAESAAPNALSRKGMRTCFDLVPEDPLVVSYIMGVTAVPAGFQRVSSVTKCAGGVELRSASGGKVRVPVALEFLD